jgi:Neprosin
MRKFTRGLAAVASVVTLSLATSVAAVAGAESGATGKASFESFGTFLNRVFDAQYQGQGAAQNQQAFGEMRSYILNLYQGVHVKHSYFEHDSYFDCVVTETQPSVRALGGAKIATPPALTETTATPANSKAATQHTPGQVDAFGNAVSCSDGTIPMQRLTLERMEKFPTLKAFMSKKPADLESSTPANAHRYGVGYQWVDNYGGNSWLNLWNPSGEFSLSQQWYVNGGQTVEGGWVHYSARWNPAVLFIFYTPDNYASGCYNLECAGFVQTSSAFTLGGAWSAYSTYGGTQWGFAQQWKYWQGNWWLYIQNTAIGYYPGSIYRGGPMGSGNANLAEFGGETYTGGTNWPQMGSGNFSGAGFGWAAFQHTIFYIDRAYVSRWSVLSPIISNPACYDLRITDSSVGGSWGTYIFFGGPGGFC